MTEPHIVTAVEQHTLLIGINNPEKRNSLTPDMLYAIADALDQLENTPDLRVGIIHGLGNHFCAGLDLAKCIGIMTGREGRNPISGIDPFQLEQQTSKPLVAAVHGSVYTAGLELALSCDIVLAATSAEFGQLEPSRGIMAQGGATVRFLQRAGTGNGLYHLLTADRFNAEEAYRIGLVQELVEPEELLERARALADDISNLAPLAVQETKKSALRLVKESQAAAFAGLNWAQERLSTTEDAMEGFTSFIEKRPARYQGR